MVTGPINLGLAGADTTNPAVTTALMKIDEGKLTRQEHHAKHFLAKEKQAVEEHTLDDFQDAITKINTSFREGGDAGYHLSHRDTLLIKTAIKHLTHVNKLSANYLKEAENDIKYLIDHKSMDSLIRKHMIDLLSRIKSAEQHTHAEIQELLKEVHVELQKSQSLIFEVKKGGLDVRLLTRAQTLGPVIDRVIVKRDISRLRRDLQYDVKNDEIIGTNCKKLVLLIKNLREKVDKHLEKEEEVRLTKKLSGALSKVVASMRGIFQKTEDFVKRAYRVFLKTMIILHFFKKSERGEREKAKKYVQDHEIPQAMGFEHIRKMGDAEARLDAELKNIEIGLLQLWGQAKA